MIKPLVLFSLLLLSYLSSVSASSPPSSYTYVISTAPSETTNPCFFKMVSKSPYHEEEDKIESPTNLSFGIAYELNDKNEFVELWRTQNWYAFHTYLASDCKHLVRVIRPSIRGFYLDSLEETIGIVFYNEGKVIKKYYISDLINDQVAHVFEPFDYYIWWYGIPYINGSFSIETTEGNIFEFNTHTGEVISVTRSNRSGSMVSSENLNIYIGNGLYESLGVSINLYYQGVDGNNKHHWEASLYEGNANGGNETAVYALPELKSAIQKSLRKKNYSVHIDKNLNITIMSARYGNFENVSAKLKFENVDAEGKYHWTLDSYEIIDLWPRRHEK